MIVLNNLNESLNISSNTINTLDVTLSYQAGTFVDSVEFTKTVPVTSNTIYTLIDSTTWNETQNTKVSLINVVNTGSINHTFSIYTTRNSVNTYLCKDVVLKPKEIFQYNDTTGFKINTYLFSEPSGTGAPGADGSVWRNGSGIPSNALGSNGDYYLNTTTEDIYFKSGGTYSIITNIKGTDGVIGANGTDGVGVPAGGTTSQVLSKINGTDYNTQWSTLTKSSVGLSNADNTSDVNKPISTATQTALDLKVDKIVGKGLSTEDYTTVEKSKLAGIAAGAEVNVNADWSAVSGDAQILNKPSTFTPSSHTHPQSDITNLVSDLAAKQATITATTSADYYRGDKTMQPLNKAAVGLSNVPNLDTTAAVTNQHTHSNITALNAVTGTNTGDETTSSIQTKRPLKTVNGNSLEGAGDLTVTVTPSLSATQIAFGGGDGVMTSSSDLVIDLTGGSTAAKIGINTSTPSVALDVVGNVKLGNAGNFSEVTGKIGDVNGVSDGGYFESTSTLAKYVYGADAKFVILGDGNKAYIDNTDGAAHTSKFGINNSTPTEALDVVGNFNINGLIKLNTDEGTTGQVLTSNGTSNPTWETLFFEPTITAGTTSQYWRGDKTWVTFPTIPSVGTWGALNFPTWTTGTPFVKMTAAGTFSLDTSTYLTSITSGNVTTALGFTPYNATNPSGYTSNLGTVTSVAALTLGTTGTDVSSSVVTGTTTPVITLNIPTASATNRGALSSTDWSTFNNKQATLVSGTNIKTVNGNSLLGSGNITVGGMSWVEVTGTSQTASVNTGYILNNASLVTLTLPTTAAVGDTIRVVGKGAGGWRVAQPTGDVIYFGNLTSTTGTSGYISSTHRRDSVDLLCVTANTDWQVIDSIGNITVF